MNKRRLPGKVRVKSVEGSAKHDDDFEPIDELVEFNIKDSEKIVTVRILDDEGWEPDEFFTL